MGLLDLLMVRLLPRLTERESLPLDRLRPFKRSFDLIFFFVFLLERLRDLLKERRTDLLRLLERERKNRRLTGDLARRKLRDLDLENDLESRRNMFLERSRTGERVLDLVADLDLDKMSLPNASVFRLSLFCTIFRTS